jgi:hypothetical protein
MFGDLAEIDLERRPADAHGGTAAEHLVMIGGSLQSERGNAAIGEVGAAHGALLDEDDRNGEGGGLGRSGNPARAAADDAYVWRKNFAHFNNSSLPGARGVPPLSKTGDDSRISRRLSPMPLPGIGALT